MEGTREHRILAVFVAVRVAMAFLSHSWFTADENWQCLEIAHLLVFGKGKLTWEWTVQDPIRSWLHPLLFVPLLRALEVASVDFPWMIVLMPRVQQGIIMALSDLCLYLFFSDRFKADASSKKAFLLLYLGNCFVLYCGSRTLVNALETSLTNAALFFYSRSLKEDDLTSGRIYVALISVGFMMRPTVAVLWLPLVICHAWLLFRRGLFLDVLLLRLLPTAMLVVLLCTSVDSVMYGKPVFVPWNFVKANVVRDVSSSYGTEPWHYYLTSTLLPVLNLAAFPAATSTIGTVFRGRDPLGTRVYAVASLWTLVVFSFATKHKEQRFLLPIVPIFICFASVSIFRKRFAGGIFRICFAAINLAALTFLCFFHKTGQTGVVSNLAVFYASSAGSGNATVLMALPCHFTPAYSHLHASHVELEFIECPPVLERDSVDESEFFLRNPEVWLARRLENGGQRLSERIVMFDVHGKMKSVRSLLEAHGFSKCADHFNSFVVENELHGKRLHVYCLDRNGHSSGSADDR